MKTGLIEYGLYLMGDGAQAKPNNTVPNSKAMGGYAIMLGGGAIDWKAYRLHTCTPDSTSVETLVASRLCAAGVGPRGVLIFIGIPMVRPTSLFTDNDGVWYMACDATSTSAMTYIMRHVRFLQQAEYDEITKAFQMEGELNPTDVMTKYKPRPDHERHHAFMMGFPERALELWRQSVKYKTYKHKKIVAVSSLVEEPHEA